MGRNRAIRRRTFLQLGAAATASAATLPRITAAGAQASATPFRHSVASGDPLPDGVLLWTRVTPSDEASPGSGLGDPTPVTWEVSRQEDFATIEASGTATSTADRDHTIRVEVDDLSPATTYWYRFHALGATSPVGRTRTAPLPDAAVDSLRLGVVTCSNWEGGWFSAYRHLADRDDLDLVLHLGDYLYEYGSGGYGPGEALGRSHDPGVEMTTLEHYRRRHAQYKTDPDLARLHQRYAFVTTIDDHEVTDNSWSDGANNHQPDEGDWVTRRAAAMRAYFEWMPIRTTGGAGEPARIYRSLRFGALAELFVLDERTYRSEQVEGLSGSLIATTPEMAAPGRTMLGPDQLAWLDTGLQATDATWKVLGNSVMFAPLILADLPDLGGLTAALGSVFAGLGVAPPIVINADQWDGYQAEQATLRTLFGAVGGVVLLTGDIHSSWAAEIPADPGTYLPAVGGDSTAVEFVTPAVTSDSLAAILEDVGGPGLAELSPLLPPLVETVLSWFKYLDTDRHGFGVFEVTPQAAQYDWYYVSDRTDRHAALVSGPSFRSPVGSNRLLPATALGPRQPTEVVPDPGTPPAEPVPAPAGPAAGGHGRLPATGGSVPLVAAATVAAAGLGAAAAARATKEPQS